MGTQPWEHTGKTAVIGLKFHHGSYDDDFVVELKFRNVGHQWQLAELSNISGLLDRLRELEERHLAELERQRQEEAVLPENLGRNAHLDGAFVLRVVEQCRVGMDVSVDKTRRNDKSVDFQGGPGFRGLDIPHSRYFLATDSKVGTVGRGSGAVDDLPAFQKKIKHLYYPGDSPSATLDFQLFGAESTQYPSLPGLPSSGRSV